MMESFIKSLLWFITALIVVEGDHLQNPCPDYVTYYCACSLNDIAEERQLKMCHYEDLEKIACHPCPEYLQEDVNCDSCDHDTCPICSLHSFGAGKDPNPHIKQEVFLKFSRDHGILYIQPLQHYPRLNGFHLEDTKTQVLGERNGIYNHAIMPNTNFSGLQESSKKYWRNKVERKENVPLNIGVTFLNSGDQQQRYAWPEQKVFREPFKTVQKSEPVDGKHIKKFSLSDLEETKNDKQFPKEKLEKIFKVGLPFPETDKSHSNSDDTKDFESYNEELKYDNQLKRIRKNMKMNSLHSLPFKEIKYIPYEKLINNEQEYSVENLENNYIIPLHILDDEATIHQNIIGKLETHAGDKCSFSNVPSDSDMGNKSMTQTVRFQCTFTKDSSKLTFRDYLLDLNDINGTIQMCVADINPFNFQEKIHLIKTNCNVSLPLTILFKYIQLTAANKTELHGMQFVETVKIRGNNFANKIEFIVNIDNLYRQRKKSAAHNSINGTLEIEIRLHLKETSVEKTANKINDIGNFFSRIPLHGFSPKLKIYQTGDSKYKFSKDGLKVKIYFTDLPSFKIEASVYELLNYFSNRSKKLLAQSRIFITVDGMEERYVKNKLNFPQSVAQKNDWIDKLLLKTWFGNSTLNISDNSQMEYNKTPLTQERRRSNPWHVFPEKNKQNIFNIAFNERDILENGLKHEDNNNDSADEKERNSLTSWIGQVFLNTLLKMFVDDIEQNDWPENFIDDIDNNTNIKFSNDELIQHDLSGDDKEPNILDNKFKSKHWHQNLTEEAYTNKKFIFPKSNWIDGVLQIIMYGNKKLNFSGIEANKNDEYVTMLNQEYNKTGFLGKKVRNSYSHEYNTDSTNGTIHRHEISEVHSKQKNMDKGSENEKPLENLNHEINQPFNKSRGNLSLHIMNVTDNSLGFSTKVLDFPNFKSNFTLKRVYRDIPQFPSRPSEKDRKRLDKIVMTHQSIMKFFNLSHTPGYDSQNFSNALWFQYRKYALIPKINETLQQKKLKNSDIFEMLNTSTATLKKLKIYISSCETCSVIYKLMLDNGFKKESKLMENDNSSFVVLMNEPKFTSHPHKPKYHASNQNKFKKPSENTDFTIQMNVNLLFLSSEDYEKLSRENAPKIKLLRNTPWEDISKTFPFRIPDNFISKSKILKLSRLLLHRNLKLAFKDLLNQGQYIEELEKVLFALLSKMHEQKTKINMGEVNRSMMLPSFNSEMTKFENIKKPVAPPEGNGSLEVNLKEEYNLLQNYSVENPHESYDKISVSTFSSDKGKKVEKLWHKNKSGSLDTKRNGTKDETLYSSDGARIKTPSEIVGYGVQSYESDEKNTKHHFEDKKASQDGASDIENVNSNEKLHFTITEYLENTSHDAEKVKDNDNTTGKASGLVKTAITINDQLLHPEKESENHYTFQFKNSVHEKDASKTENIKTWSKKDEENPNITLVQKAAGEIKHPDNAVIQDLSEKSETGKNFYNFEIPDRKVLPADNKNVEASRSENIFSSEQESTKEPVKLVTTMHHISEIFENETKLSDAKTNQKQSPENDSETIKETSYMHKDTLNTTASELFNGFRKIRDDGSYSLNEVTRMKRILYNSSDISDNRSDTLSGGAIRLRLNESEKLHHRQRRHIPNNNWCPIMSMRRNGNLDCTIWTFKKSCKLECHPGFTYNGQQAAQMTCVRRGGSWKIDVNQPCKPSKGGAMSNFLQGDGSWKNEFPPIYRSGGSEPLTSDSKGSKSPPGKNPESQPATAKSSDKKASPAKDSKSPNVVADSSEDDDYYENYDYPEK